MDKTTGFSLLALLLIVLASGWSRELASGGGGGIAAAAVGGGGGAGGGGDLCGRLFARMQACKGEILSEIPERYRDEASAEFDAKMAEEAQECRAKLAEAEPEEISRAQGCLAAPDCASFVRCF